MNLPRFTGEAALYRHERSYLMSGSARRPPGVVAQQDDPWTSACCRYCASIGQRCMELRGYCYCVPHGLGRASTSRLTILPQQAGRDAPYGRRRH